MTLAGGNGASISSSFFPRALAGLRGFHNHTILFQRGRLIFATYGLVNGIAFVAASILAMTYAQMAGRDPVALLAGAAIVMLPSVLVGARAFSILLEWRSLFERSVETILKPGYMLHGGVVGGAVGLWLYTQAFGGSVLALMDAWALALPLGEAIARVGCHVYGCCWGKPTDSRLSIAYTSPHAKVLRMAPHLAGRRIYPAQLFGTVAHLGQLALLVALMPLMSHVGMMTGAYLATHALLRVLLERFRQDDRGRLGALTHTNAYSGALGAAGLAIVLGASWLQPLEPLQWASPFAVLAASPAVPLLLGMIFMTAAVAFGAHVDRLGAWMPMRSHDHSHGPHHHDAPKDSVSATRAAIGQKVTLEGRSAG